MLLNDKNYKEALKGVSVVEVSGESCANCLTLMPILNKLVREYEDVILHHVEADMTTLKFMDEFKIEQVPTILILSDDEIVARCKGFQPEEILELWLEAKIDEAKKKYQAK